MRHCSFSHLPPGNLCWQHQTNSEQSWALLWHSTHTHAKHRPRYSRKQPRCGRWQRAAYSGYSGFQPGKDRMLSIKLSLAKISGSLDLSWMGLQELDPEIFQLTDLEELTIAGNRLELLPKEIGQLTNLRKLQAAGNLLHTIPDCITKLTNLQGIWLHGNLLEELPHDIGKLQKLETLALAGNCIQQLPEGIEQLVNLKELSLSGNGLQKLPDGVGRLSNLVTLSLNGNCLESLPAELSKCSALQNVHLQMNRLKSVPAELGSLQNVVELNLADNMLENLPEEWYGLQSCESIWLYGNQIRRLPEDLLSSAKLECLWVENNPLDASSLSSQSQQLKSTKLREVGLDTGQAASLEGEGLQVAEMPFMKSGKVLHGSKGYFKLRHAASPLFNASAAAKVLVVTFASAPGTPNWGGLLGKYVAQATPEESKFDILYVCDGSRSWYSAGDEEGFKFWEAGIQSISKDYERVIMLGDSMGASAALLFSHLATCVQAFTPQVDLANASIRPGRSQEWLTEGKQRILQSVTASSAKILVHTGTWDHDLEQAKILPKDKCELVVHHLDSHRLAIALHSQGQLLPLIRKAILGELGLYTAPRLVNLL